MKRGFTTIELMIAMTIMTMVLAAVVVVSFSNQMFLAGTQSSAEALAYAQNLLENEQALARKDFNLVNATTTTDGFYTGTVSVINPTVGGTKDYFSKALTATVTWKNERGLQQSISLNTIVANFGNTAGGNTCNSSLAGDWNPPTIHTYTLKSLAGLGSGSYPITAVDAYRDRLYVTAGPTSAGTDKTFFIFNLNNGVPSYVGGIDSSGSSIKGPNAVQVVSTTTTSGGKLYAYIANGVAPDWNSWSSCSSATASCSQLQVIDVTSPAAPVIVTNFKFATSSVIGSGGQAVGQSILYKNGYVFLGLSKTASGPPNGPEFHVIDVHNPLSPQEIGNFNVDAGVEGIVTDGSFAYLATDDTAGNNILTILNVDDPLNPSKVWPGVLTGGIGYGRNLALIGDKLHFARTADSSKAEWSILNNANPKTVAPTVGSQLDLGNSTSINNILIRDNLTFLTTSTGQLLIRNSTSTAQYASPISLPAPGTALDCEGNFVYVGSGDPAGTITVLGQ